MKEEVHYKAVLSYNGSSYHGFQLQTQGERTIQGDLYKALDRLGVRYKSIIPSGRTDAGVHALNQVIKITIDKNFENEQLKTSLNSILNNKIYFQDIESCKADWSPRTHAKSKTYSYVIFNHRKTPVFHQDLLTHIPYELDWLQIEAGMKAFIGSHDFKNFFTVGTPINSSVRTIFDFNLRQDSGISHLGSLPQDSIKVLEVTGDGFLKQMVRLIVGALLQLGQGKIAIADISRALKAEETFRCGPVAPPQGLYLKNVNY